MLVQTNTRCAPPELYRAMRGFPSARLLENELRDSARQFTRSGYKCLDDTNVAGAVAEKFFLVARGNGWSPINDIGRYTVLESSLPVAVCLLAEAGGSSGKRLWGK